MSDQRSEKPTACRGSITEKEMQDRADYLQASAKRTRQAAEPQGIAAAVPGMLAALERMKARGDALAAKWRPRFDAMEPIECEIHFTKLLPDWEKTFEQSCHHQEFKPMYQPCPTCGDEDCRARKRRYWARRGMPERLSDATFDGFETTTGEHQEALEFAKASASNRLIFLLLLGDNGQGKSHLGAAALKARGEGFFVEHKSLIDEIRGTYNGAGNTVDVIEKYQDAALLVLDEVGMSTNGKDEQPHLHEILAKRHDRRLPTILTSNKSLPELKEILGFRLMDRIAEDYECRVLRGESYRRKK